MNSLVKKASIIFITHGMKIAGASLMKHLAHCMFSIGYKPCNAKSNLWYVPMVRQEYTAIIHPSLLCQWVFCSVELFDMGHRCVSCQLTLHYINGNGIWAAKFVKESIKNKKYIATNVNVQYTPELDTKPELWPKAWGSL